MDSTGIELFKLGYATGQEVGGMVLTTCAIVSAIVMITKLFK